MQGCFLPYPEILLAGNKRFFMTYFILEEALYCGSYIVVLKCAPCRIDQLWF